MFVVCSFYCTYCNLDIEFVRIVVLIIIANNVFWWYFRFIVQPYTTAWQTLVLFYIVSCSMKEGICWSWIKKKWGNKDFCLGLIISRNSCYTYALSWVIMPEKVLFQALDISCFSSFFYQCDFHHVSKNNIAQLCPFSLYPQWMSMCSWSKPEVSRSERTWRTLGLRFWSRWWEGLTASMAQVKMYTLMLQGVSVMLGYMDVHMQFPPWLNK